MKRNINLIELSRDHHHGLLLGWKIKNGVKRGASVEEIRQYVIHFATQALFPHFEEEEQQLLVFLNEDDPFRMRTIKEHAEIKELVQMILISDFNDLDVLLDLAQKVEAHIRFEERELFPYMESLLTAEELAALGKLIAAHHQPYVEVYQNEFWTR